jgi:hypothetical protein
LYLAGRPWSFPRLLLLYVHSVMGLGGGLDASTCVGFSGPFGPSPFRFFPSQQLQKKHSLSYTHHQLTSPP